MTRRHLQPHIEHRAQQREHAEPTEQLRPIPKLAAALTLIMVLLGAGYLLLSESFGRADLGDRRTLSDLRPSSTTAAAGAGPADGKLLYTANCVACHQATGQGVPGVFPPLAGSQWVQGDARVLASILLHGVSGDIVVAGKSFRGAMPSFAHLGDAELAAIASYIRGAWANGAGAVAPEGIVRMRQASARTTPFAGGDELEALGRSLAQQTPKQE